MPYVGNAHQLAEVLDERTGENVADWPWLSTGPVRRTV